ncbi:hypothetical protein N9W89_09105 [Hellea sp.]|nr:hypothetical protein [Hellea sp.]
MRSIYHTAGILASMFIEFGETRMRISKKTLRSVGRRKNIRDSFVYDIANYLSEIGIEFIEIERGYCLVKATALNGSKSYTYKKFREHNNLDTTDQEIVWKHVNEEFGYEDYDENE